MAFRGIHPAPEIEPVEFGLFAYAKPEKAVTGEPGYENQWVRGFSQYYITSPSFVRNWDETSSTSYVLSSSTAPMYREIKPIFIEVEDFHSTFDVLGDDRFERVKKQLEGVSQKALEYELWNGDIAQTEGLPNPFLTDSDAVVISSGTAFSPRRAMALLEHYVGEQSPAGEHGVIHLTRDAFNLIAGNSQIFIHAEGKDHIQTVTGTPVIVGSGYSGDGPHIAISTIAVSSNVATVVTTGSHYLVNNDLVKIQTTAGGTAFDGDFTVTKVNATTFTFPVTTGNQSATATAGTVQQQGTDDVKWIYATGQVHAHMGPAEVVNDNLAQGYGVAGNRNDMRIKATRPAAAYFDPSIHLAIKVDLTA